MECLVLQASASVKAAAGVVESKPEMLRRVNFQFSQFVHELGAAQDLRGTLPVASLSSMTFPRSYLALLPLLMAVVFSAGPVSSARAGEPHVYSIVGDDGYGLTDCLAAGGDCGKIVADAFCEAHGNGAAIAFGPMESLGSIHKISTASEGYYVSCAD